MNVEQRCGLLPAYQDVLDRFVTGFDQGIPSHVIENLMWYTPDNHRSSELAKDKIEESIKKELKAGRAVVNGDGEIRPINNLSYPRNDDLVKSVNSYVNKGDFETTWDDFKIVSKFLSEDKRRFELALFDWEKAYQQIPTRHDQWRYLLVKNFEDKLLVDTRITFGKVAGCGSFGRPADAWKLIMKKQFNLVNVFCWVDDNLFIREEGVTVSMKDVVKKSDELGVKTNVKKYSEFSSEQKFIGFVWNGFDKTVRLPEGKIEQRLTQIYPFMVPKANFDYEEAEILVGRLNHVSYILPHLRCNLCSIYRWLKSWLFRKAKRFTPEDVLVDLTIWIDTLKNFEHTRLICWGPPLDVGWVGDASTSFRIAIHLGLLMLLKLRDQKGKSLIVWTDNTKTENSINNKKTKDKDANNEWMKIQRILVEESVDLVARRVKSKDNKADALSRGVRSGQHVKNQVVINMPADLEDLLEQVVFKI
ncbi:hypothetical protein PGT21_015509 [Puccinia graminis f. sp. tritici]|uniref:Reverse transcriptase domain-containing protein n=1 Tax=Puccinia graminis f. sp. tritici TaxID=56615 RepID=A0A5B0LQ10_PUCGR|nr:hypothetical protein PGT21_015509 [Puccinia graminis f. sp. tritici]